MAPLVHEKRIEKGRFKGCWISVYYEINAMLLIRKKYIKVALLVQKEKKMTRGDLSDVNLKSTCDSYIAV